VILAVFQLVNAFAVKTVDGTFLFPAYTGGFIVFSVFTSVFIFKEKLNLKQIIGLIIGLLALVLMNF
jgi:multidrug transporter EmrE-like cation transporter